jgi:cytochrome P450/NADPH-cytochrome P450 reductase
MHLFVNAMVGVLIGAGERARRPPLPSYFFQAADKKFQDSVDLMLKIATDLVKHRRENPSDKKDLLNAILYNKDPQTGENLSNESIAYNMITFLIAGKTSILRDWDGYAHSTWQAMRPPRGFFPLCSMSF